MDNICVFSRGFFFRFVFLFFLLYQETVKMFIPENVNETATLTKQNPINLPVVVTVTLLIEFVSEK